MNTNRKRAQDRQTDKKNRWKIMSRIQIYKKANLQTQTSPI